ncbi:MAG: C4-type zinc ribbon domain-containing protein [Acidobacteriota bacterium]
MSQDLEKLIALQGIDLKIQQLTARLSAIPVERERIEARFQEFSSAYQQVNEKLEVARKERRRLELELEETQRHHEKYKEDLMKVRNEKEYTTCLREIDSAKKTASQLETQILQLLEEIEQLEAEVGKYAPEIENRRRVIDAEIGACERELIEINENVEKIKNERLELIQAIPKSLFERYERISRLRNGIVVAEAIEGSCSACRMKIRPQAYSDVRRGEEIVICENCSRMLYYQPKAKPETESASSSD